jgi:alpha-galactosidase
VSFVFEFFVFEFFVFEFFSGILFPMNNSLFDQLKIMADTFQQVRGGGLLLKGRTVSVTLTGTPKQFLYHGWQSWTLAAWVDLSHRMPAMRPAILHPMQADPVHIHEKRPHGSWYGAVEMEKGGVIFLGSLGLDAHVVLDGTILQGAYESNSSDWFLGMGEEEAIFKQYASLLKERLGAGRATSAPRVWCSWYSLYTEITEKQLFKILGDLNTQEWPVGVFQIDDGWQQGIGDWEPNSKFASGMEEIAAWIKAAEKTPGLWLAPLLAAPSSSLFKDHPDWMLRDPRGKFVSAGFNWGEPMYALDTTHPGALAWLAELMKKVRGWGYDYVKLDFLYAGALPGQRHFDMPREAAYRSGLKVIREALGEAYFLTCGAPILPSIGLCDAMRIGPDVASYWDNRRDRDLLGNYAVPGGQNALRTSLHRLWLQPLLHTDPDVVYFRSRQNRLTADQKAIVQDLALVSSFKATSDVPSWLTPSEQQELKAYFSSRPAIQKTGRYTYRIDGRDVDFSKHIEMPPLPGVLTRLWGGIVGGLANVPVLMKLFDRLGRQSLKRKIGADPV